MAAKAAPILFVEYNPARTGVAPEVRAAAAKLGAGARRATFARKRDNQDATSLAIREKRKPTVRRKAKKDNSADQSSSSSASSTPRSVQHDAVLSVRADYQRLYVEVVNNPALWRAAFLSTRTWRGKVSGLLKLAPYRASVLFMKQEVIRDLTIAVVSPHGSGPLAAAIGLMAAWERLNGDQTEYEVHVKAWRTTMRGAGVEVNNANITSHLMALSDRIVRTVSSNCVSVSPITEQPYYAQTPVRTSAEFWAFDATDAKIVRLLILVDQLARFDPWAPDADPRLRELSLRIILWEEPQIDPASHLAMCLRHVSSAAKALLGRYHGHPEIGKHLRVPWDTKNSMLVIWNIAFARGPHNFDTVVGSDFEKASFWALWLLCSACGRWDQELTGLLAVYLKSLGLSTLPQVRRLLESFAWSGELLDSASELLFNDVQAVASSEARKDRISIDSRPKDGTNHLASMNSSLT